MYLLVVVEMVVVVMFGIIMVIVVVFVRLLLLVVVIMMFFVVLVLKVDKFDVMYKFLLEFILKYVFLVEVWLMEYVILFIKKGYYWISSLIGFCNFF